MDRQVIIQKLEQRRAELMKARKNLSAPIGADRNRPDMLDKSFYEEIRHLNECCLSRINEQHYAIESIMSEIRSGWDFTCDRCKVPLSEERVTDDLKVICPKCWTEIFGKRRTIVHQHPRASV
jgi:hypothetical protein